MRLRVLLVSGFAGAVGLLAATGPVNAERARDGVVEVSLNGGITPRKLPRRDPVPVAFHLAGGVQTADDSPLPRVNWIRLELAWRGILHTKGLPVCPLQRIASTDTRQAIEACGPAAVGRGSLYAKIFVPNQSEFGVNAQLVAFNGKTKAGRVAVLVHAYVANPPVSFVLPFTVYHRPGAFRTILVTTIRRSVGPWPHVSNFRVRASRVFRVDGKWRSYLSASCPVPPNFTAGPVSLARATYTLAGGAQITTESVRNCRVRNDAGRR